MKYLMLVCADASAEPYDPAQDNVESWVTEMDSKGVRLLGDRLATMKSVKTVKRRNGSVIVTDGPFVESKEVIVGFDVLECGNINEAVEVAAKHPMARFGSIEVRPSWTVD
jgi:hypothetical protein